MRSLTRRLVSRNGFLALVAGAALALLVGDAPTLRAADWTGSGGSASGNIVVSFNLSSAVTLSVVGTSTLNGGAGTATTVTQVGGANTDAAIAYGTVAADCVSDAPDTGDCVEISVNGTDGANIVSGLQATLTYSGCGANSGTIDLGHTLGTMPTSNLTPRFCEIGEDATVGAACTAGGWSDDTFGTVLTAGAETENGRASGYVYDFEIATKIRDADTAAGGPFGWTLAVTGGCT